MGFSGYFKGDLIFKFSNPMVPDDNLDEAITAQPATLFGLPSRNAVHAQPDNDPANQFHECSLEKASESRRQSARN